MLTDEGAARQVSQITFLNQFVQVKAIGAHDHQVKIDCASDEQGSQLLAVDELLLECVVMAQHHIIHFHQDILQNIAIVQIAGNRQHIDALQAFFILWAQEDVVVVANNQVILPEWLDAAREAAAHAAIGGQIPDEAFGFETVIAQHVGGAVGIEAVLLRVIINGAD